VVVVLEGARARTVELNEKCAAHSADDRVRNVVRPGSPGPGPRSSCGELGPAWVAAARR
jgi:hypothetical protein